MARGGKRDNSGRPKGTTGIKKRKPISKSREVAILIDTAKEEMRDHIRRMHDAPPVRAIEVMRKNMAFFDSLGETFLAKAQQAHEQGENPIAIDFLAENARYRMLAQKCAEAIVPYEERRLAGHEPLGPEGDGADGAPQHDDGKDRLAHLATRFRKAAEATVIDVEAEEVE